MAGGALDLTASWDDVSRGLVVPAQSAAAVGHRVGAGQSFLGPRRRGHRAGRQRVAVTVTGTAGPATLVAGVDTAKATAPARRVT
jgi:hypothetical protein